MIIYRCSDERPPARIRDKSQRLVVPRAGIWDNEKPLK
jgi:hypothetical protein